MKTSKFRILFVALLALFVGSFASARFINSSEQATLQSTFNTHAAQATLWGQYYAYGATDVAYWAGRVEGCYTAASIVYSRNDTLDLAADLWALRDTCFYLGVLEPNPVQRANYFGLAAGFDQEANAAAGF